eukprot:TRINITY_DN8921_c2_g1_i1.p1 TRINITY_DN8921_c2_g1~~TRINITY_DN8921_c2_g1_i1.p1  ORF type:complete len:104 (+),score=24.64 TRINITY_DN8921_c2_g1_i1:824-1135(+)
MLFVIVDEALNALMEKAKHLGLIKDFVTDNADNEVTHLQLADDTILFCDASLARVYNLKVILKWFEFLSGLKMNYGKCEMIGVWMEDSNVTLLANVVELGSFL